MKVVFCPPPSSEDTTEMNKRPAAPTPTEVAAILGVSEITIDWLAGDGSDRCYYRLHSPDLSVTRVLMLLSENDARALRRGGYEWVKIGKILTDTQIEVPQIVAAMPDHAALIIEDYGDITLENMVQRASKENRLEEVKTLYDQAFQIVCQFLKIKGSSTSVWCQRSFDEERFVWEMNFFRRKFLEDAAKLTLSRREEKLFQSETHLLGKHIAAHSDKFVHRDFHSRNIMVQGNRLAVIDFQDARLGPAAYDFVSLVFDSYVPLGKDQRSDLMRQAIQMVRALSHRETADEIERTWSAILLQRQLKAIGSFGYLTIEKRRGDYLKYVPAALDTLLNQNVADERWPFLSGELLHRIHGGLV